MSHIKAIIGELHRRSLWQVTLVFLGTSWVVLQVIDTFVERGIVPDWTFTAALLLLLIGLPVVLATAFVQEGPRTAGDGSSPGASEDSGPMADVGGAGVGGAGVGGPGVASASETADGGGAATASETPGAAVAPTPAFSLDTPGLAQFLTWNRAILGGVLAFALLGVVATAYMGMRMMGVGTPGTLVAQGVFEEGEVFVLADFDSDASSASSELVTETLRMSLERSPTIRPLPTIELADALSRMEEDPGVRLSSDLATELAAREGIKAVLGGTAAQVGGRIVLSARLIDVTNGQVIAQFQESASDTTRLVDAIDDLGKAIRDKAGEPLGSINAEPPLRQVTTGSLEALRLYSQAHEVERRGEAIRAADLYREATRIDPDFAMAHRKLGVQLGNSFGSRTEQVQAYTRAYELRDRLPPIERFVADATYFQLVMGDLDAAARAYETVLEMDPTHDVALNNLGIVYGRSGKHEEAERVYRLALETDASNSNYNNLAANLVLQEKKDEAWAIIEEWKEVFPESYSSWMYPGWVKFSEGDHSAADSLFTVMTDQFPRNPMARFYGNAGHWIVGLVTGQFEYGDAYGREFVRSSEQVGLDQWALNGEAMRALSIATYYQDTARANEHLDAGMAEFPLSGMDPLNRSYLFMSRSLLELGRVEEADSLFEEFLDEVPEQFWGDLEDEDPREVQAMFLAARGDVAGAIDELRPLRLDCSSLCRLRVRYALAGLYAAQGDLASAAQEYEEYITRTEVDRLREDYHRLPRAMLRLGEIHEQLGNVREAALWYERFAELWNDADPEFQPTVDAARSKAAELRAQIS